MRIPVLTIAGFFLLSPFAGNLHAQTTSPHLAVTTTNGQATFRVGERIPLTLTFTGEKSVSVTTSSYDRSGRLGIEIYSVAPSAGWSDPLADYFAEGMFDGGGLYSIQTLEKPFIFASDLNEWVRFDQPGDYTLTVSSHRANRKASSRGETAAVQSAPVVLHILAPTPEWQRATLTRIQQTLAVPRKDNAEPSQERKEAIADLRFLATPDAVKELASHLREDQPEFQGAASFGLLGLPSSLRETAIATMNELLDAPAFPVSQGFLWDMATLQGLASTGSTARSFNAWVEEENVYRKSCWQAALSALSRKQNAAQATTAQTLLSFAPTDPSPQAKAQIGSVLGRVFLQLSLAKQTQALNDNWDVLRSLAMVPILRKLSADTASHDPHSGPPYPSELKSAAFHRWYELDPDAARREILAQIGSPTPSLTTSDVWFLPPQSFPQWEAVWANALVETKGEAWQPRLAALLARFGTGASSAQVRAFLSEGVGRESCNAQDTALAYLVRFDTDAAASFLTQAVAARDKESNGCRHMLFTDIPRLAIGPSLTQAAVQAVSDPDAEVVTNALEYLKKFGDASALQPILARYLEWVQIWSAKVDELDHPDERGDYASRNLGWALGSALLANQGWIADKQLTSTVLQHCLGKNMCQQLRYLSERSDSVIATRYPEEDHYEVGPFTPGNRQLFEAKIAQYPEGTSFSLIGAGGNNDDQRRLDADTTEILARHHMKVLSCTR